MKYRDHRDHHRALTRHVHLLRAAINLAQYRSRELFTMLQRLGEPLDREKIRQVQLETAKELGGVRAKIPLDIPGEILKHYFGPLHISLALLHALIARYCELEHANPVYRDDLIDEFRLKHADFVHDLEAMRHSILHDRYANRSVQVAFEQEYTGAREMRILLDEGAALFEGYVERLRDVLKKLRKDCRRGRA